MKKYFYLFSFLAVIIFPLSTYAVTYDIPDDFLFRTDLYKNMESTDVLYLQRFLNGSSDTLIADTGPGSKGSETEFFGELTENAVIRLQNKYKDDILTPVGLSEGTGIVGPSTRGKLNDLLAASKVKDPTKKKQGNGDDDGSYSDAYKIPKITGISGITFAEGETIVVTGAHFDDGAVAKIGGDQVETEIVNPTLIKARIPEKLGMQLLEIKNGSGSSAKLYPTYIIIVDKLLQYLTPPQLAALIDAVTKANEALGIDDFGGGAGGIPDIGNSVPSADDPAGGIPGGGAGFGGGGGGMGSFGGKIMSTTYCTCSEPFSILVNIDDYSQNHNQNGFMYIPGQSTLHAEYSILEPGPYVVGGHDMAPSQCMVYAGESCVTEGNSIGNIDNMRGVGTSAQ